jgi:hypothetical protein
MAASTLMETLRLHGSVPLHLGGVIISCGVPIDARQILHVVYLCAMVHGAVASENSVPTTSEGVLLQNVVPVHSKGVVVAFGVPVNCVHFRNLMKLCTCLST